jgi:hypothetical protein
VKLDDGIPDGREWYFKRLPLGKIGRKGSFPFRSDWKIPKFAVALVTEIRETTSTARTTKLADSSIRLTSAVVRIFVEFPRINNIIAKERLRSVFRWQKSGLPQSVLYCIKLKMFLMRSFFFPGERRCAFMRSLRVGIVTFYLAKSWRECMVIFPRQNASRVEISHLFLIKSSHSRNGVRLPSRQKAFESEHFQTHGLICREVCSENAGYLASLEINSICSFDVICSIHGW